MHCTLARTVTFLKKLSIFAENKDEMLQLDIMQKLVAFVNTRNPNAVLQEAVYRLLFNLSFDATLREQAIDLNMLYVMHCHRQIV
jgi:hypothetical protein